MSGGEEKKEEPCGCETREENEREKEARQEKDWHADDDARTSSESERETDELVETFERHVDVFRYRKYFSRFLWGRRN